MKRLITVLCASAVLPLTTPRLAIAQTSTSTVVTTCGTQSYTAGTQRNPTQDTTGNACGPGSGSGAAATVTNKGFASADASGTVTAGGTYQTVFASSSTRKGCTIQNPTTATEILSVRVTSATVYTIPIGATFQCGFPGGVVTSLIEVTAATTGHAFSAASE